MGHSTLILMRGQVSISGYPKGEGYTRVRDVLGRPPLGAHRDLSAEGERQTGLAALKFQSPGQKPVLCSPSAPTARGGAKIQTEPTHRDSSERTSSPSNHALRRLRERVELAPASFLPSHEPYRRHPVPGHDHLLGRPLPRGTAVSDAITAQQKPGSRHTRPLCE